MIVEVAKGVWTVAPRAHEPGGVRRVCVLMNAVKDDPGDLAEVAAFRQGFAELGWVAGQNIHIELRWSCSDIERVRALAKELVGLKSR
jgi:putative tryptophan/tyrosine transport system substrate-binding protein